MLKQITMDQAKAQLKGSGIKQKTVERIEKALHTGLYNGKCLLVSKGEVRRLGYKSTTYSPMGALGDEFRAKFKGKKHVNGSWIIYRK
jgi:hypothetical protein